MELNEILKDMSKIVDKDSKYLKGLYTKSKNELTGQFGEAISDTRIMSLALAKVGKQYGMTQGDVDKLINGDEDEDDLDFLDDEKDDDGLTIYDDEGWIRYRYASRTEFSYADGQQRVDTKQNIDRIFYRIRAAIVSFNKKEEKK